MEDEADEPLIHESHVPGEGNIDDLPLDADESRLTAPTVYIYLLTVSAAISGLLFGYDTGVISATLVSIRSDLSQRPLTTLDKSLITSCTSLSALIASPVTGALGDALGRKRVIILADILFLLGALWQAFTGSVWGMIGGRGVVGLAVGSASFITPMYISELSPSPFRGRLVTVSSLFITGGQVIAYVVGWLLSEHAYGWRLMVGIGALPAAVQFLILTFLPETPRWLVKAGRKDEAKRTLTKAYGRGKDMEQLVEAVLRKVEKEVTKDEAALDERHGHETPKSGLSLRLARMNAGFAELFEVSGNRRALAIACTLQGVQQLCGFNSLMYFSATIFSQVGFASPTLTSLSIATTNFLFTLVAFRYIDRIGRRRILLFSLTVMIAGLAACTVFFGFLNPHFAPIETPGHLTVVRQYEPMAASPPQGNVWPTAILVSMVLYVAGYAIGMGNVPWQQSELFPLSVRSTGSSLATSTNWASNWIVGLTFLPMMEGFTPAITFAIYTVVCVAGLMAVYIIYPETAGMSLEDVGSLLKNGWGIQEGERRWQERRRGLGI